MELLHGDSSNSTVALLSSPGCLPLFSLYVVVFEVAFVIAHYRDFPPDGQQREAALMSPTVRRSSRATCGDRCAETYTPMVTMDMDREVCDSVIPCAGIKGGLPKDQGKCGKEGSGCCVCRWYVFLFSTMIACSHSRKFRTLCFLCFSFDVSSFLLGCSWTSSNPPG